MAFEDNGPGIPEELEGRLFESFATHGKRNGTGLGLAIVKGLVEAHRGTVNVLSEIGVGTTFTISLPR
jgi:signal transduction histidine kinase